MKTMKSRHRTVSIWIVILGIVLFLSICCCTAGAETVASGECGNNGDNLTWVLDDEGILTISGTGDMKDYLYYYNDHDTSPFLDYQTQITQVIITDGVTGIGNHTFYKCSNMTSISLPNSMTRIGKNAFWVCSSLSEMTIPDHVSAIGEYAFSGCSSLTEVAIPEGVTVLDRSAFAGCSSLTEISIPESVTSIGYEAFNNCISLTKVSLPDNLTEIWGSAFSNCKNLTEIELPEGLTKIYGSAFRGCYDLESVTIPESLTSIGEYAFYCCSKLDSSLFLPNVTNIGQYAFYGCGNLTGNPDLREVTSIGQDAFYNCSGLSGNLDLRNATSIGNSAFYNCSSLSGSLDLRNTTSIGNAAFYGCSGLTGVVLSDKMTSIGNSAFKNCSALNDVYYTGTLPEWNAVRVGTDNDPLTGKVRCYYQAVPGIIAYGKLDTGLLWTLDENGLLLISGNGAIPDYSYSEGAPWSTYNKSISNVEIQNGVTAVGSYALRGCDMKGITVPVSVTSIGDYAFYGCNKMTEIALPASVSHIGEYAFCSCQGLHEITLPDDISDIGQYAFSSCTSLESFEFPSGMTEIPKGLLYNSGLTEITIPEGVTFLPYYFLRDSRKLKTIMLSSTVDDIQVDALYGLTSLENIYVAEGNTRFSSIDGVLILTSTNPTYPYVDLCLYPLGRTASHYTIPDGVTMIQAGAFRNEKELQSVTIPASLTWITQNVFTNTSSLTHIYFEGTEEQWESMRKQSGTDPDYLATATVICNYQNQAWSDPTYVWSDDNTTVTATRIYQPDTTLIETETVDTTVVYTIEPSCTESGMGNYQAVFRNPSFETQTSESEVFPALGHATLEDAAVAASCTEPGLTAGSHCERCNMVFTPQTVIPALEHDPEMDTEAVAATCTTTGWTAASHCKRCGIVLSERTETPALGHEEVIDEARAATCTEPGLTAGSHCSRCGFEMIKQETIPELGHDPVVDEGYSATYMADGLTEGSHCQRCNATLVPQQIIPMLTVSGTCGDNLTWILRAGVLTISGSGDMNDYGYGETPWYDVRNEINQIVVEDGVTGIGKYAFHNCENLTSITISEGVTELDSYSIYHCWSLKEVYLPSTLKSIKGGVFVGCNQIVNYHVTEGNTVWSSIDGVLIKTENNPSIDHYQVILMMYPHGRTASHYAVPDGVTLLNSDVFKEERDLISVTIPTSVTWIGTNAFTNTSSLTHIYFMGTQDEWASVKKDPGNSVNYLETATVICEYQSQAWSGPTYEWIEENRKVTATRTYQPDSSLSETETVEVVAEYIIEPTCTEAGTASSAMAVFANPAFATQTKTDITIGPKGHTIVTDAGIPATCIGEGLTEGRRCSVCGEILAEQEPIPALGHDWDEPVFNWAEDNSSVSAARVCRRDDSHIEDETVSTTFEVTTEPTCTEAGEKLYLATFENAAFGKPTKTVVIPAIGHTPVTDEAVDATCTGSGLTEGSHCSVCGYVIVEQETISQLGHNYAIIPQIPATCEETGLTQHVACTRCGDVIVAGDVIPKLGHDWGEVTYVWADDNSEVTATRICNHDNSHVETETVGVNAENTLAATCENMGQTTYTSDDFENGSFEVQSLTLTDVAALGHAWGTPTYEWTEDHRTVIATTVCAHDAKHQQSETVSVSPVVTVSPEEDTPGTVTYRAVFENDLFSSQEETETIQALEDLHVLRLPASLTRIEAEAFDGIAAEAILVPESCTDIAPSAFINCDQLRYIRIPAGVEIPENAFIGCPNVIIDQR